MKSGSRGEGKKFFCKTGPLLCFKSTGIWQLAKISLKQKIMHFDWHNYIYFQNSDAALSSWVEFTQTTET